MNLHLAPTYQRLFGDYWVLWFKASNSYSVIDSSFKYYLDAYLQAQSLEAFGETILSAIATSDYKTIAESLNAFLKNCNHVNSEVTNHTIEFDSTHRQVKKTYNIKDKCIAIHYDSELVLKTIHPSLAHLCKNDLSIPTDTTFDIYLKADYLHLFKANDHIISVPKRDYHLLQGKFIMSLLCEVYDTNETDWVSTFHGSTITDDQNAILFIGPSGKGKSTLSALLATNGYTLLADDVSPMLADTNHIYHNPLAVSIKKGAYDILSPRIPNLDALPKFVFNPSKGDIVYVPFASPNKASYPCKIIIQVNYKVNATTELKPISIKTLLETLIQDSWLSPNPKHAKQFLDWLEHIEAYKLTYSDTEAMEHLVSDLFYRLRENGE